MELLTETDFGLSPIGVAIYPHINRPCTRFSGQGLYSVTLAVPDEEAERLRKRIDERMAASYQAALDKADTEEKQHRVRKGEPPYSLSPDGKETHFVFRIKARGVGKNGKPYRNKVHIYNSRGKLKRLRVSEGAEIRVSFRFETYNSGLVGAGVVLRPNAVQVVKLAQDNAAYYGFTDVSQPASFGPIK